MKNRILKGLLLGSMMLYAGNTWSMYSLKKGGINLKTAQSSNNEEIRKPGPLSPLNNNDQKTMKLSKVFGESEVEDNGQKTQKTMKLSKVFGESEVEDNGQKTRKTMKLSKVFGESEVEDNGQKTIKLSKVFGKSKVEDMEKTKPSKVFGKFEDVTSDDMSGDMYVPSSTLQEANMNGTQKSFVEDDSDEEDDSELKLELQKYIADNNRLNTINQELKKFNRQLEKQNDSLYKKSEELKENLEKMVNYYKSMEESNKSMEKNIEIMDGVARTAVENITPYLDQERGIFLKYLAEKPNDKGLGNRVNIEKQLNLADGSEVVGSLYAIASDYDKYELDSYSKIIIYNDLVKFNEDMGIRKNISMGNEESEKLKGELNSAKEEISELRTQVNEYGKKFEDVNNKYEEFKQRALNSRTESGTESVRDLVSFIKRDTEIKTKRDVLEHSMEEKLGTFGEEDEGYDIEYEGGGFNRGCILPFSEVLVNNNKFENAFNLICSESEEDVKKDGILGMLIGCEFDNSKIKSIKLHVEATESK